jgi:hypothetical protein
MFWSLGALEQSLAFGNSRLVNGLAQKRGRANFLGIRAKKVTLAHESTWIANSRSGESSRKSRSRGESLEHDRHKRTEYSGTAISARGQTDRPVAFGSCRQQNERAGGTDQNHKVI